MKNLLKLLSISVFLTLASCHKKEEGFWGDVHQGKYEIQEIRKFNDGTVDTLIREVTGPYFGGDRYGFVPFDFTFNLWEFKNNGATFYKDIENNDTTLIYRYDSETISQNSDKIILHLTNGEDYFHNPLPYSMTVTINRIVL